MGSPGFDHDHWPGQGAEVISALFCPPSWATSSIFHRPREKEGLGLSSRTLPVHHPAPAQNPSGSSGWPGSLFPGSGSQLGPSVQIQEDPEMPLLYLVQVFLLVMLGGMLLFFILYVFCWDITDRKCLTSI